MHIDWKLVASVAIALVIVILLQKYVFNRV
jgi:hypothetical protein